MDLLKLARDINRIKQRLTFQLFLDDNTPATDIPRILLYVNPDTLTVRRLKQSSVTYTYGGFVTQHWHPQAGAISANGFIGGFKGEEREASDVYKRFQQLVRIYKLCGKVLDSPDLSTAFPGLPATGTTAGNIRRQGGVRDADYVTGQPSRQTLPGVTAYSFVELTFGHERFRGVFDSFDITYDYSQPNTVRYTFNFSVFAEEDVAFDLLDSALEAVDLYQTFKRKFV